MKALVIISNYGLGNIEYLFQILEEYEKMDYDFDVQLHTTERVKGIERFKRIKIFQKLFHQNIGRFLTFSNREEFIRWSDDYDLFIYSENDLLITQKNIDTFLKYDRILPDKYLVGFLRYELDYPSNEKFLIELHLIYVLDQTNFTINGQRFFTIFNIHQGCFILSNRKMNIVKSNYYFQNKPIGIINHNKISYGKLERGASEVFINMGFQKVYPFDEIDNLLIHHLPNKYKGLIEEKKFPPCLSLDELMQLLKGD